MLTTDDKEEIRKLIAETVAGLQPPNSVESREATSTGQFDDLQDFVARIRTLALNEGFTELTFTNPATGERRILHVSTEPDRLVEVTARAIEVFGTREKALRWLRTPVRGLGNQTPISLLQHAEGVERVTDALGQVEHGVW